jgi:hypothetical protein
MHNHSVYFNYFKNVNDNQPLFSNKAESRWQRVDGVRIFMFGCVPTFMNGLLENMLVPSTITTGQ